MSVLAPVLLVAVLGLFVLAAMRLVLNGKPHVEELKEAKRQARVATAGLRQIQRTLGAQIAAGYPDLTALAVDVQDTLDDMQGPADGSVMVSAP